MDGSETRPDDSAIVSSHFNPCGYRLRERNLKLFVRPMVERGLPLFLAELVFPGRRPALAPSDGWPHVTHFHGRDVLWHKERLINLTVARLPARYTKVAWIDADVLFPDPAWYEQTSALLDSSNLVQLFDEARQLDNEGREILRVHSVAGHVARGRPEPFALARSGTKTGMAWAAKRSILEGPGLLDIMILGGADEFMTLSAYDAFDQSPSKTMRRSTPELDRLRAAWAAAFREAVGGQITYLPGTVVQLGHGSAENRKYADRQQILARHDFDPAADLAPGDDGVWRWASPKPLLHADVARYFEERREDG